MLWERGILDSGKGASQAIGYKEFLPYFRGECTLADVREAIITATRHYAKRQITWFSRRSDAIRIVVDKDGAVRSSDDVTDEAQARILERLHNNI